MSGISFEKGDIVLIRFPFTDLKNFKKRPVLIINNNKHYNDIVCFQITSNKYQKSLLKIQSEDLENGKLILESFVKYDKCFTLDSNIIEKKLAKVTKNFFNKLEALFCNEVFKY